MEKKTQNDLAKHEQDEKLKDKQEKKPTNKRFTETC